MQKSCVKKSFAVNYAAFVALQKTSVLYMYTRVRMRAYVRRLKCGIIAHEKKVLKKVAKKFGGKKISPYLCSNLNNLPLKT